MDELQKEKIGQDLAVTLPSMQLKVFRLLKTIKVLLLYQRECYSMLLLSGITLASIIQASRCASGATVLYKLSCHVKTLSLLRSGSTTMWLYWQKSIHSTTSILQLLYYRQFFISRTRSPYTVQHLQTILQLLYYSSLLVEVHTQYNIYTTTTLLQIFYSSPSTTPTVLSCSPSFSQNTSDQLPLQQTFLIH